MRRCWWAVAVVAGVLAMHGLQCMSHDLHAHAEHGVATSAVPLALPAGVHAGLPPAPHEPAASGVSDSRAPAIPPSALGHPAAPRPTDFWTACLTVVASGLMLLTAVLLRGWPAARGSSPWSPAVRWASAPALLRPPDLFALCVLRN